MSTQRRRVTDRRTDGQTADGHLQQHTPRYRIVIKLKRKGYPLAMTEQFEGGPHVVSARVAFFFLFLLAHFKVDLL